MNFLEVLLLNDGSVTLDIFESTDTLHYQNRQFH